MGEGEKEGEEERKQTFAAYDGGEGKGGTPAWVYIRE